MEENKDYYCLETEIEGEIPIEVTWRVRYHQERHLVGDFVAWDRWHEYEVDEVRRTDTDDTYSYWYEAPREDWHFSFDEAYIKGDIQAS